MKEWTFHGLLGSKMKNPKIYGSGPRSGNFGVPGDRAEKLHIPSRGITEIKEWTFLGFMGSEMKNHKTSGFRAAVRKFQGPR